LQGITLETQDETVKRQIGRTQRQWLCAMHVFEFDTPALILFGLGQFYVKHNDTNEKSANGMHHESMYQRIAQEKFCIHHLFGRFDKGTPLVREIQFAYQGHERHKVGT
jgi:hypothetical protein